MVGILTIAFSTCFL